MAYPVLASRKLDIPQGYINLLWCGIKRRKWLSKAVLDWWQCVSTDACYMLQFFFLHFSGCCFETFLRILGFKGNFTIVLFCMLMNWPSCFPRKVAEIEIEW